MADVANAGRGLGLAHFSVITVGPAELVSLAAQAGFARVGFRLIPPFEGAPYYPLRVGSRQTRDLLEQVTGEGIQVYDIEAVVIDEAFNPLALEPMLETGQFLGAQRLTVSGDDRDTSRLTANFSALCEIAARYGMAVDMENMGWRTVATFEQAVSIVSASAAPNAGVLVDALHFFRNGAEASALSKDENRIRSVQLCDARGLHPALPDDMIREARAGRFAPGEGDLPLQTLLEALPRDAVLSVEVPQVDGSTPEDHVRHLFKATRTLLETHAIG